jgi:hypothetical protein
VLSSGTLSLSARVDISSSGPSTSVFAFKHCVFQAASKRTEDRLSGANWSQLVFVAKRQISFFFFNQRVVLDKRVRSIVSPYPPANIPPNSFRIDCNFFLKFPPRDQQEPHSQ